MFDWSAVRGLVLYRRAGVCAIGVATPGRKLLAKELIRIIDRAHRLMGLDKRRRNFVIDLHQ